MLFYCQDCKRELNRMLKENFLLRRLFCFGKPDPLSKIKIKHQINAFT